MVIAVHYLSSVIVNTTTNSTKNETKIAVSDPINLASSNNNNNIDNNN